MMMLMRLRNTLVNRKHPNRHRSRLINLVRYPNLKERINSYKIGLRSLRINRKLTFNMPKRRL